MDIDAQNFIEDHKLDSSKVRELMENNLGLIGNGTYGEVYLVPWEDGAAVLKMAKPRCERPELENELMKYKWLEGTNIAPLPLGICMNPYCIVMTYIDGFTFKELSHQEFNWSEHVYLMLSCFLCKSVYELHGKGLVHNDLKPDNVMVDRKKKVFLIDMGNARTNYSVPDCTGADPVEFPWIAPELLQGEYSTYASDIYSLGFVLYHFWQQRNLAIPEEVRYLISWTNKTDPLLRPSAFNLYGQFLSLHLIRRAVENSQPVPEPLSLQPLSSPLPLHLQMSQNLSPNFRTMDRARRRPHQQSRYQERTRRSSYSL